MFGEPDTPLECDLLVVGSGAGGLSAAVSASHLGLSVIVVEKESYYGGTSAWSGGWMWIPRNPLAVQAQIKEDIEQPLLYLRSELGDRFDEVQALTFLTHGPRMVEFFRSRTALQFIDGNVLPDFHGNAPAASSGGRSVGAAPFDGRRLKHRIKDLKPPLYETTLWGMGIASGAEMRHFFNALKSWASFRYVSKKIARHLGDLLLHGRGMQLVNGNALVAALAHSLLERSGQLLVQCPVTDLTTEQGRVTGATVQTPTGKRQIRARCAVVLACGGFPHDVARKAELLSHAPTGHEHWSAAPQGNTGDGLRLGESAGGYVRRDLSQAAALAPVSWVPRKRAHKGDSTPVNGHTYFAHLVERAKPGVIAVNAHGQRFGNEANSYHDFMQDLLATTPLGQTPEAWLLCDRDFLRRYGLGAVKPWPMPKSYWLKSGYLRQGRSLAELAYACGIHSENLARTIQRYNGMAREGYDADFGRGQTLYNRIQGDSAWAAARGYPNPCMAPLQRPPYYAVKIQMGSLGTFAGLNVNEHAQVVNTAGEPVPGLYACGNDMSSMMQGSYPAGGITLGPAMTFGFLAAHHLAGIDPCKTPLLPDPL